MFDQLGMWLSQLPLSQVGAGGGGQNPMALLQAAMSNPQTADALITKLATQSAPPVTGTMTGVPGLGGTNPMVQGVVPDTAGVPRDSMNPLGAALSGRQINLGNSAEYGPQEIPQSPQQFDMQKFLAAAGPMTKAMYPQQQTPQPPNPAGAHSYGSTNMAKAPGYLPTTGGAPNPEDTRRRTLAALLGAR